MVKYTSVATPLHQNACSQIDASASQVSVLPVVQRNLPAHSDIPLIPLFAPFIFQEISCEMPASHQTNITSFR